MTNTKKIIVQKKLHLLLTTCGKKRDNVKVVKLGNSTNSE